MINCIHGKHRLKYTQQEFFYCTAVFTNKIAVDEFFYLKLYIKAVYYIFLSISETTECKRYAPHQYLIFFSVSGKKSNLYLKEIISVSEKNT